MKKYFIANWKMNLLAKAGGELIEAIKPQLPATDNLETVVCPSFTALPLLKEKIKDAPIFLGAQNMSWLDKGSLTGEISPLMLKEWGVKYVIVGHSERRQQLGENNELINQKMQTALRHDLIPILCVGETFTERQEGRKDFILAGQVEAALQNIALNSKPLFIAYEPVWVIGSGQAVKLEEAEHAVRVIKQVLVDLYPDLDIKKNVSILYGGSVSAENLSYFNKSDLLQGVLVGGASLKAEEFSAMLNIMAQ